MIRVADIMLVTPPYVYSADTVDQTKIIANFSRLKGIPVLLQSGSFAGILDRSLVCQERIPGNAAVSNYMNTAARPLQESDPLVSITKMPLDPSVSLLPVLSDDGHLTGVIPDPWFIKAVAEDIIECLASVLYADVERRPHGVIIINEDGKIVCFNKNAEGILGMKGRDLYGIHINKVIHDSQLCEVLKKGYPQWKKKLQADKVTLCSNRFPLYQGDEVVGAVGIFEDISEQEMLLENLRMLRGLNLEMNGILESLNDGIIVMGNRGQVIRVNSAYEYITGLSAHQIMERDVNFLIDQGYLPAIIFAEAVEKMRSFSIIEEIRGRDFLFIANPVFSGDGKLMRVVVIIKDIAFLNEIVLNLQVTRELASRFYNEMETMKDRISQQDMVANSTAMRRVVSLAHKVAQVDSNVLITGETGVGKEVVARSVHRCSNRLNGPFIKLNCGAIPEPLLESELFGYDAGAFTGAKREGKPGLIELADGGSLFLDEVADLPVNLQVKLLRVLQEREVMRVGGTKYKKVDFRLIAATNKDLEKMVKQNLFREDLYYRLNVIPVFIPPLRDRKEDIVPLTMFFLNKFNKKYGLTKKLSPEVIQKLLRYDWPGNIRALENTIERLIVTSDSTIITLDDLREKSDIADAEESAVKMLHEVIEDTEKRLIYQALQQCKTTREMAKILGISQSAVVKKMKKHGMTKLLEEAL
ncbi:MAG: sigma 54-interacting transcriptional regulator [Thermodesulfovibrionales bacterium]